MPETVHYVEDFEVFVTVPLLVVGIVEVNLASAPFTTNSFSQGQRLVKLVIVTSAMPDDSGQYRIGCTTPPNGMVTPPGYYI
ncbi:hypothetical protein RHGRI_015331 [Rhododendron griersonianum]|uniref:Galactose oxidase-like Early set domain-containing protein n=1 Tax=Rhododendron griersonianum TaxID=479676 RepID=A0AAV6KCX0_9ERIC|nr:hypothetical protein RHGRI_015331 [Rhododendron griersonianum]